VILSRRYIAFVPSNKQNNAFLSLCSRDGILPRTAFAEVFEVPKAPPGASSLLKRQDHHLLADPRTRLGTNCAASCDAHYRQCNPSGIPTKKRYSMDMGHTWCEETRMFAHPNVDQ
jgi:hypothetical protein